MKEIDFPLYADKAQSRTFGFTNLDDSIYDFTGSTVVLKLYLDPEIPTDIGGSIVILTGKVTFNFTTTHTDNIGIYEYLIEETKSDTSKLIIGGGNILIKEYVPFSETIEAYLNTELPADITLTENYRIQRITYWRRFLMDAFDIPVDQINIDASWTVMQNAFIAKLVAYDALMLAARGNLLHILGGDYSSTTTSSSDGGIRSIETGPARVEYFPTGDTIQKIFSTSSTGTTVLDTLISDICGLASFLKVKVPMCKGNKITINPLYYQNEDWHIPTLDEQIEDTGSTVVSQGSDDSEE